MPRHATRSPYCTACRLRLALCICRHAPRLRVTTRVILIMHAAEWAKATNTGHLTRLAVRDADIRLHGLPHQPVASDDLDPTSPSTLVLYPGRGAIPLTAGLLAPLARPVTLLVPDGNWAQAKNMMRRVPLLCRARTVHLDAPRHDLPALRENRAQDRRSTFEAIAQALGLLEQPAVERAMLTFFRRFLAGKKQPSPQPSADP